jgi:hypothetical protein
MLKALDIFKVIFVILLALFIVVSILGILGSIDLVSWLSYKVYAYISTGVSGAILGISILMAILNYSRSSPDDSLLEVSSLGSSDDETSDIQDDTITRVEVTLLVAIDDATAINNEVKEYIAKGMAGVEDTYKIQAGEIFIKARDLSNTVDKNDRIKDYMREITRITTETVTLLRESRVFEKTPEEIARKLQVEQKIFKLKNNIGEIKRLQRDPSKDQSRVSRLLKEKEASLAKFQALLATL